MEVKAESIIKERENEIAIEAIGVKKYFEEIKALDGLFFKIRRGECFGFLGPNGAGKITMINLLSCYLKPTSGTAFVVGFEVLDERSYVKKHLGIAPQENIFYEELSVYDFILFLRRELTRS